MHHELTREDVLILAREPSPEIRAAMTSKIAIGFNMGHFPGREREIAIQILRLLTNDAEVRVRRILAETLKHNSGIPRDVALRLAGDVTEVALPMLEYSPVLTENDLLKILACGQTLEHKMAIARRESVPASVCHALVQDGAPEVALALVDNKGTRLQENTIAAMLERHAGHSSVLEALVYRGGLPMTIAGKLLALVGDALQTELAKRYGLKESDLHALTDTAREHATLELAEKTRDESSLQGFVRDMQQSGDLTHTTVLRSLCRGDLRFFEISLATLLHLPLENTRRLMRDPQGFKALYQKAGMPDGLYDSVQEMLVIVMQETQKAQGAGVEAVRTRLQEHLLSGKVAIPVDNVAYLIALTRGGPHSGAVH